MARIPETELARLKAEVSVQRLVEGCGVVLRQQGAGLVGVCPFHEDSSPSLVITPAKNLWHCLGACQRGGGPIDWVMTAQGVSFRHAVELLREDSTSLGDLAPARPGTSGPVRRSSAAKLEPIAAPDAEDQALLGRVVGFYAEAMAGAASAQEFLARRRIADPEVVATFKIGFSDRTLGYRLPNAQTKAGAELRSRLRTLGVLKASGHEHFRGCLTIPVLDQHGAVGEVYGRRVQKADPRTGASAHLYLPGPHRGVWNPAGFGAGELIVCESLIDALTLWCAGFRHVTASYGADGWTPEHQAAVVGHGITRVLIAYDRDAAGDAGAKTLAEQLTAVGVECWRVELPTGADVNDVAVAATAPAEVAGMLGRFLRQAAWMGPVGAGSVRPVPAAPRIEPAVEPVAVEPVAVDAGPEPVEVELVVEAAPPVQEREPEADAGPSEPEPTEPTEPTEPAEQVGPVGPVVPELPAATAATEVSGRELVVVFGPRRWRVRGLEKVTSFDLLRVNLLVTLDGSGGERFHVDTLDLYSARARGVFVTQAAAELQVAPEVVKADLGRVLLACEARAEEVIAAAQAPKEPEVVISPESRAAAMGLLTDPDLVGRIEADFAAVGMVGEATNCLVGYLAAVSRKLPAPLAVLVQSTSAAGKSAVMEAVLGFVPAEDRVSFSAMTGQSLFYMGETDLAHKVLSIAEEEGASRAAYALKLLQSEGELSIASTGKDTASGRLVTHTYKVTGPTAIVLTTTAIDIDEELLNRCLVLTVDEERDQTRAIHQAQRRAQTLQGLSARAERDRVIGLHQDAQRLVEPLAVINPYADALTFADVQTRTRRDHGKYLGLIAAVTLLHQHQRPRKSAMLGGRQVTYVEATVADIQVANRLAHAVLGQTLDELPPQTRRLLTVIHGFVGEQAKRLAVEVGLVRFTRRHLREHSGWGDTVLKKHLARLVDLELVIAHRAENGGYGYELAWRGEGAADGDGGQRFVVGLTDPTTLTSGGPGTTTPADPPDLHGYDADRSPPSEGWSPPGRGPVAGWSHPGHPAHDGQLDDVDGRLNGVVAAAGGAR